MSDISRLASKQSSFTEDKLAPKLIPQPLLSSSRGEDENSGRTCNKRNAPEIEGTGTSKKSSWSLLAAWDAQENMDPAPEAKLNHPPLPLHSQPFTSNSQRTLSPAKSVRSTSTLSSKDNLQHRQQESQQRKKPSPGAYLRLQSATTSPAPHPLPELMRLTTDRHLVPMSRIIHSMASLSRAGRENSQRKTNQDSCFAFRQYVQPYQAIAGVLDGHGPNGHTVSGFIKQNIPIAISEQLRRKGEISAASALSCAFLEMQSALQATSSTINARLSGSTAVISLLQGKRITTAWVGDSRAMLVRREIGGGWRGIALTQDHKPTSATELSRILAAGGRVEKLSDAYGREVGPQRVWLPGAWVPGLAMSRALGDFVAHSVGVIAEPEVHCCELEDRDEYLVVASDGVWEFMSLQEAADVVGGCMCAEDACRVLVDAATEKWRQMNEGVTDDISAVVAKFLVE